MFCGVIYWATLLPFPQADWQLGDSQNGEMHFDVRLSRVNKLGSFITNLELPFGLFCGAIRLLTECVSCPVSCWVLHETASPLP